MCGLVGVVGRIYAKEEKVFQDMLTVDVIRGPHSTGIMTAQHNGDWAYSKSPLLPYEHMQLKASADALKGTHCLMMGHNRYATVGSINKVNAHPFEHDGLIGMHNGTLRDWRRRLNKSGQFDVDSDCLFYNIQQYGVEDTIPDVEGAYALTFYDETDHTFHILRNKERPLFFAPSEDGATIFYASEPWMITGICGRHDVKIKEPAIVPEDIWVKYKLPSKVGKPMEKPTCKQVKGFTFPVRQPGSAGQGVNGSRYQPAGKLTLPKDVEEELIELRAEMEAVKHQRVRFQFLQFHHTGTPGSGYFEGLTFGCGSIEVRVFMTAKQALDWGKHIDTDFVGANPVIVAPYYNHNTKKINPGYLIIEPRGIEIDMSTVVAEQEPDSNVIQLPAPESRVQQMATGPDGDEVTEEQWDKLTKEGCAQCQTNLFYGDEVVWLHNNAVLCLDCDNQLTQEMQGASVQ